MPERVLDGGADRGLGPAGDLRLEIRAREDPREWNRKPGLLLPPLTEVRDRQQAVVAVREAALVDDQPGVHLPARDRSEDPVVAQFDDIGEAGRRESKQEERRRR